MPVVVAVDEAGQKLEALVPVRPELADPRGVARIGAIVEAYLERFFSDRLSVRSAGDAHLRYQRAFHLRRGVTRGIDLAIWLDGQTLRVQAAASNRLDMLWGLIALAAGGLVGLFAGIGYWIGMGPHVLHSRYWWLVALLSGGAASLLVAMLTWVPKQALSKRGRFESFALGQEIVREIADVLGAELGPPDDTATE